MMNLSELINIFSLILTQKNKILLQNEHIIIENANFESTPAYTQYWPAYATTDTYGTHISAASSHTYTSLNATA